MSALPPVHRLNAQAGAALVAHLRAMGIDRSFVTRHAEGADTLFSPLSPTRAARYSPHPAAAAFRALFCALPDEDDHGGETGETIALAHAAGIVPGAFHLRLVRGLFLFSDYLGGDDPAAVMGAGETTALLYESALSALAAGRDAATVLDLGCGAGTLALLLSGQHAAACAIGTDINPRAIALARFNAAINGIANAEFRVGDLYAPVAEERFSLIVSQPPYYPPAEGAPHSVYLHGGGSDGSALPARVIVGAGAHLEQAAESCALVFCAWPEASPLPQPPGCVVTANETGPPEIQGTRQYLLRITPSQAR